jgi:hypothetical protein
MDVLYILAAIGLLFLPLVGFAVGLVMFDRRHRSEKITTAIDWREITPRG